MIFKQRELGTLITNPLTPPEHREFPDIDDSYRYDVTSPLHTITGDEDASS